VQRSGFVQLNSFRNEDGSLPGACCGGVSERILNVFSCLGKNKNRVRKRITRKGKQTVVENKPTTRQTNLEDSFWRFSWRITSLHTISYTIAGLFALFAMGYKEQFSGEFLSNLMRPINSPYVALGPLLQLINGFFMSLYLFPIKKVLTENGKNGWKILFLLVAGFSFFTPQIPGIGNFEGLIYTKAPLSIHLMGIPECLAYSLLFSSGFGFWYRQEKKWMNPTTITLVCLIGLMSVLGYLDSIGILPKR